MIFAGAGVSHFYCIIMIKVFFSFNIYYEEIVMNRLIEEIKYKSLIIVK